ncbi:hypothetical protein [Streptomyces chumphonensis]|uniref:hypothetical protein n=1 Tax=Streptomyces chumphonensis TaxID=1214925 RepID=UPI003D739ACF
MNEPLSADDLADIRQQGDLADLFAVLLGKPAPTAKAAVEEEPPSYHIARPGAWPCGTTPAGPSPGPRCPDCQPGRAAA